MPGPITYAAVALMVRDRLQRIDQALGAKIARRGDATSLERQVRLLAAQAHAAMGAGQPTITPPARLYGPPQGDAVSKFLFMGAVGPEFTGFAALYAPLQRWLRDTLHKGTPDAQHEQALGYSTDFLLSFWRQAQPAVTRQIAGNDQRLAALAQLRSYALGHACHIATDVVTGPYVDALEARLGDATRPKLTRAQAIAAIEAEVLRGFFGASAPPNGHEVDSWWPEAALVPKPFYTAFREALEATYGAGARREGGAPYEAQRAAHAPPALSGALLEDGYRSFRQALGMGQSWSLLEWMGFTSAMYLPALLALPVAGALPLARDAFRDPPPAGLDRGAAKLEAALLPFALGSVVPLAYTFGLHLSPLGAEGPVIANWVSAAAQVIAAIIFFATLGSTDGKRALLLLPLLVEIGVVIYTLTQVNADNPRRWLLALAGISHLALGGIFILLLWAFLHKAPEALNDGDAGAFVGWFLLWLLILGAFWMGTALLMRYLAAPLPQQPAGTLDSGLASLPPGAATSALVGRSTVQLIDEAMLSFTTPLPQPASPVARYFPTDRRPLLKLWWTGGGAPTVLARQDRLVFTFGATVREVAAPAVPLTLAELMAYLKAAVTDGGGQARLQASLHFADQAAFETVQLPPGLVFADHGDERGLQAEHDAQALVAKPLGDSEASAYVLFAAPRWTQAVRFDRFGPHPAAADPAAVVAGSGVLTADATLAVLAIPAGGSTRFTRLFRAGDLIEVDVTGPPPAAVRRVVLRVDSDTQLTLAVPLPSAPVAAGSYRRPLRQQSGVEAPPAGAQARALGNDLVFAEAGASFGAMFGPGDVIRLQPGGGNPAQDRVVAEVLSDSLLRLHRAADAPLGGLALIAFARVAGGDDRLYELQAGGDDNSGNSRSLMHAAADLGTLLSLGLMSHLLDDAQRNLGALGPAIQRSQQVFRNWNLDRRRVNEWRMLVQGGAVDEKAGRPGAADAAMASQPAGYSSTAPDGDATARALGWVPLLRHWLEMSARPGNDAGAASAYRAGLPGNVQLSRALAHLLDQAAPPLPGP